MAHDAGVACLVTHDGTDGKTEDFEVARTSLDPASAPAEDDLEPRLLCALSWLEPVRPVECCSKAQRRDFITLTACCCPATPASGLSGRSAGVPAHRREKHHITQVR
jgi:hypothetical protein